MTIVILDINKQLRLVGLRVVLPGMPNVCNHNVSEMNRNTVITIDGKSGDGDENYWASRCGG